MPEARADEKTRATKDDFAQGQRGGIIMPKDSAQFM